MKRTYAIAAVTGAVGLATLGLATASADSGSDTLAQKIAQRFNLNQTEVQAVIDEQREARHTEMRARHESRLEDRLQQAVDAGELTADQKSKIVAKVEELHSQRQHSRTELEQWAGENDIPTEFLRFGRHGHGPGHDRIKSDR